MLICFPYTVFVCSHMQDSKRMTNGVNSKSHSVDGHWRVMLHGIVWCSPTLFASSLALQSKFYLKPSHSPWWFFVAAIWCTGSPSKSLRPRGWRLKSATSKGMNCDFESLLEYTKELELSIIWICIGALFVLTKLRISLLEHIVTKLCLFVFLASPSGYVAITYPWCATL